MSSIPLNLKSKLTSGVKAALAEKIIDHSFEAAHTSGDVRAYYLNLDLNGVGGNGEAFRPRTRVYGTGINSAHGVHSALSIQSGGAISGLGAGLRATLEASAESRTLTGTLTALQVDGNIGTGNTVPGPTSLIRLAKAGAVDIPFFLDVADDQCLKGDASVGAADDALAVRMPNGTTRYIALVPAS